MLAPQGGTLTSKDAVLSVCDRARYLLELFVEFWSA
jgi:hypothetical protein